ncbi:MAG: hypothetical protein ACREVX_03030 [Clostridium sp.]|uniref:hypothetical protein n=1 Tax=Clostridium sp. TaxID=1506 RepID=UPI003D6CBBAA
MNIIPNLSGTTPNYYCTWTTQNYGRKNTVDVDNATAFDGIQGAKGARNYLNEEVVFSKNGFINQYELIRKDLYFVFDDGWDVPYDVHPDTQRYQFGSLELNEERFPSCSGNPQERLKKLNEKVKSYGWRGAGLWVAAQAQGDGKEGFMYNYQELEDYWRKRAIWSRQAGIEYWKVDWGVRTSKSFREMLSRVTREEAPSLIVEHSKPCGPINDDSTIPWSPIPSSGLGRYGNWGTVLQEALELSSFSDVLRTYDVTNPLSTATTLDRIGSLLGAEVNKGTKCILNCEDELYIGAALGCSIGILRSGLNKIFTGMNHDLKNTRKSLDEAVRAVRWQRIAPAYAVNQQTLYSSKRIHNDTWKFNSGESWAYWLNGNEITQACPAIISRGMSLPIVENDEDSPFIVASCHPNGAISIASLPRTDMNKGVYTPKAVVRLSVDDINQPIAVFGHFHLLICVLKERLEGVQIWAQDLAGDDAIDITDRVCIKDYEIILKGDLINAIGLMNATAGDTSEPGMVMKIIKN